MRYLLGVKPGNQRALFKQVHAALNTERCQDLEIIDTPDRERGYRWINDLTLNDANPDCKVNDLEHWEIIEGHQQIWSWVTDLPLSAENVEHAGKSRTRPSIPSKTKAII
jgi:hypothetical protein